MEIVEGISKARAERVQSTIQFPYTDISDAIAVAIALHRAGGLALSRDQLAAQMNQVPNSGSFNTKVSTAKIFGVMDTARGSYQLSDLGFEIVDPNRAAEAMVTAFLNVPLYQAVYNEFRGKRLPPRPLGLEQAFVKLGVSAKQARNARLAFEKSARLAGFHPNGDEERLVMPVRSAGTALVPVAADTEEPIIAAASGTAVGVGAAKAVGQAIKPLEYQLVDLLSEEGVGQEESAAIWTLVRFLKSKA